MIAGVNVYSLPKILKFGLCTNMGAMVSPILLVVILQFESQYLKHSMRYIHI